MKRPLFTDQIVHYFRSHPLVALFGPRQSGKTTLARMYSKSLPSFSQENYFDLENNADIQRLKNPLLTLSPLIGLLT